jgi:glyoxylase-like metal-dependent hydrolase (beta-lactamase superfamily II)
VCGLTPQPLGLPPDGSHGHTDHCFGHRFSDAERAVSPSPVVIPSPTPVRFDPTVATTIADTIKELAASARL